jgi:hypothetical protein
VGGRYQLGSVPKRLRRRTNLIATAAAVVIGAALMVGILLVEGVRFDARTWAILLVVAAVVVLGIVVSVRSLSDVDRQVLDEAERRRIEPPGLDPLEGTGGGDVIDLDADPALDVVDLDAVRVPLRPGPIWSRRLVERPDLRWIAGDRTGLDVPAWLLDRRPRTIDPYDLITIRWSTIERFRVRAESDGPNIYDITCGPTPGMPTRWRIRRHEITDEVTLLDHARTVGRITIELEDSISS